MAASPFPRSKSTKRRNTRRAPARRTGAPTVRELIVAAVSSANERSGLSLVSLKKVLRAGGYDVTRNNSRVKVALKGLVAKGTLVRTKGPSGCFKINTGVKARARRPAKRAGRRRAAARKPRKKRAAKRRSAARKPRRRRRARKPAKKRAARRRRGARRTRKGARRTRRRALRTSVKRQRIPKRRRRKPVKRSKRAAY